MRFETVTWWLIAKCNKSFGEALLILQTLFITVLAGVNNYMKLKIIKIVHGLKIIRICICQILARFRLWGTGFMPCIESSA